MHAAPTRGIGDTGHLTGPVLPGTLDTPSAGEGTTPYPPTRPDQRGQLGQLGAPTRSPLILTIIYVSCFMVILDNSIVFTGLPQIRFDMGFVQVPRLLERVARPLVLLSGVA